MGFRNLASTGPGSVHRTPSQDEDNRQFYLPTRIALVILYHEAHRNPSLHHWSIRSRSQPNRKIQVLKVHRYLFLHHCSTECEDPQTDSGPYDVNGGRSGMMIVDPLLSFGKFIRLVVRVIRWTTLSLHVRYLSLARGPRTVPRVSHLWALVALCRTCPQWGEQRSYDGHTDKLRLL